MSLGKVLRQRRMCPNGRSVIVAIDHGNAAGIVRGLENPIDAVKTAARWGADGILVTPGVLNVVAEEIGELAIILRIDGGSTTAGLGGPMRLMRTVEQALRMGADAVVINATIGAAYEADELEKVGRVAAACEEWGVPLVAEILSERMLANHMDFSGSGDAVLPDDIHQDVSLACRIGAELGADLIKTRYPGNEGAFRRTVAGCGRPILVAGGPMRGSDLVSTLILADESMRTGAAGVVFGRTIWQQPDPAEALRAVCAIVHEDASVEEALNVSIEN